MTRIAIGLFLVVAIAVPVVRLRHHDHAAAGPTRAGAVRAAADALYELSIPAITDHDQFEAQVVRLAAPGAEQRVETAFGATPGPVRAAFSMEPHVLRGAPLGYRVDRFSSGTASVSIWSVALAASDGFGSESQWRTITLDLRWVSGGWKVTDGRGETGPEPTTPLPELARESATFRSFVHVP